MDTNVIKECTGLSLAGKITFPEVVKRLIGIGMERYIADLVGKQVLYFGLNDETYSEQLVFDAPKVAQNFDPATVAATIKDIQQGRIQYREFLQRIMASGCSHYEVFITGKQAVYFGRDGSQHIEKFPQAKQ